ncbi:MAG: hypothetical protein ACOC9J_03550 [Persicimonas sp.]
MPESRRTHLAEVDSATAEFLDVLDDALDDQLRQRLVSAKILTVDDIEYPDSVHSDEAHLGYVLLYLLDRAGLSDVEVTLEAWTLDPGGIVPLAQPFEPIDPDARLAYGGTEGGRSLIIFDPAQLDTPDNVIGAAALVVAEIYRDLCGLDGAREQAGHTVEDELCAVALGFGVLLANASLDFQHFAEPPKHSEGGGRAVTVTRRLGELGPYRLGSLLAAQATARGDSAEADRIKRALGGDPRQGFDAAMRALTSDDVARFQPGHASPVSSDGVVDMQKMQVARSVQTHLDDTKRAKRKRNRGTPVFRLQKRREGRYVTIAVLAGIPLVLAFTAAGHVLGGLATGIFGILIGAAYGRFDTYYQCSDIDCLGQLDDNPQVCPECGGIVAGDIDDMNDRLEAAEEWEAEHASKQTNTRADWW